MIVGSNKVTGAGETLGVCAVTGAVMSAVTLVVPVILAVWRVPLMGVTGLALRVPCGMGEALTMGVVTMVVTEGVNDRLDETVGPVREVNIL